MSTVSTKITFQKIFIFLKSATLKDFCSKLYYAILNDHKNVLLVVLNFSKHFFPVALWLALFKNAALIPTEWRPKINVKWLPLTDALLFDVSLVSILFYISITLVSVSLIYLVRGKAYLYILIALSWPILNLLNYQVESCAKSTLQDFITYTSYVLLHLIIPIITAAYLYVCHIPGIVSLYSWCLGLQNLVSIITHLSLPSSPPWFIHINGINATADYSTLGYAAELTRIDRNLGWNLVTNGFHKSPIVFGAFPSVHSGMAVCTFLFINWFSTSCIIRAVSGVFVVVQWWATIYLDHHWRFDLYTGMFYSLCTFLLLNLKYKNYYYHDENSTNLSVSSTNYIKLSNSEDSLFNEEDYKNLSLSVDLELQPIVSKEGSIIDESVTGSDDENEKLQPSKLSFIQRLIL